MARTRKSFSANHLTRVEKVSFVRGDADVDFQYVADVIDMAHHA